MSRRLPRKERKESVCGVECACRVRGRRGVYLSTTTETSQGVEHARAQEADEAEHDELRDRVIVYTLKATGSLEAFLGRINVDAQGRARVLCERGPVHGE